MNKEFIPYEQALELEEIGFNEPCLAHLIGFGDGTKENGLYKIKQQQVFYPGDYASSDDKAEELGLHPFVICGVPLYQQAFRWFREKYGLHPHFCFFTDEKLWNVDIYAYLKEYGLKTDPCTMKFKAYEEAEYACLNKLIEIIKNNNNENLAHK
jgi:hypothetical protein